VKARRLLSSGRLTVVQVDEHRILARCQGDHGDYELGWDRGATASSGLRILIPGICIPPDENPAPEPEGPPDAEPILRAEVE
jgi:hypothetical protein